MCGHAAIYVYPDRADLPLADPDAGEARPHLRRDPLVAERREQPALEALQHREIHVALRAFCGGRERDADLAHLDQERLCVAHDRGSSSDGIAHFASPRHPAYSVRLIRAHTGRAQERDAPQVGQRWACSHAAPELS
jgi:hypothetical protein